jgi:prepilin-type N-terminal cleavage/methylation domain-containing protein
VSFKHRQHAFTLIELLVTLAVIGVLLALIIPAVQSAREAARRTACASNLRQLCLAMHQYEATYRVYPPGVQVQAFSGPQSYSKSFGSGLPDSSSSVDEAADSRLPLPI